MKKYFRWLLLALGLALAYLWACGFFPLWPGYHGLHYSPEGYARALAALRLEKKELSESFSFSGFQQNRAANLFAKGLYEEIRPFWLGTRYGFYGTSTVPGEGEIACGYFVTTCLRDVGVTLERAALARMASEQMIKRLLPEAHIRRYSNRPLSEMLEDIRAKGKGVYVVGLDTHTGFLVNLGGGDIRFLHSTAAWPWAVVDERAADSRTLRKSRYRVTGCLTCDGDFLRNWLRGNGR